MRVLEPWVERPLQIFVTESGARTVAVLTQSGQVIAQHGFATAADLMAVASLSAGIMAAAGELSRVIGAPRLRELAFEGRDLGIYLAAIDLPERAWIALVGYGRETSLGLVQLFFMELVSQLDRAVPGAPSATPRPLLAEDFEAELDRSLRALFGR